MTKGDTDGRDRVAGRRAFHRPCFVVVHLLAGEVGLPVGKNPPIPDTKADAGLLKAGLLFQILCTQRLEWKKTERAGTQ